MEKKTFSINEALNVGWQAMKEHFWLFFGCIIVALVIVGIPRGIGDILTKIDSNANGLFYLLSGLINIVVSIGFIRITLKIFDGEKPEFTDLFTFPRYFIEYLGAAVVNVLIVIGGLCLFIIPGIYWAIKFQFFGYCVVDKDLNPIHALRQSSRITKTVKWKLLWFGILLLLINVLGLICLVIGLFATIPTTIIAYAYVYRKLVGQSEPVREGPVEIARQK